MRTGIRNLKILLPIELETSIHVAVQRRKAFKVSTFGEILIRDRELDISPFDFLGVFELIPRTPENELAICRLKRKTRDLLRIRIGRARRAEILNAYIDVESILRRNSVCGSKV